jgi:hypothetical protein
MTGNNCIEASRREPLRDASIISSFRQHWPVHGDDGSEFASPPQGRKNQGDNLMAQTTWCPKCGKRMVPVVTISGRTDLQCISCDDPALKSAESRPTAPEKPIELERV